MKVRRVVTGHDSSGKAIFVSDGEVEPVTAELLPGSEFHKLWGGDRAPQFPDDGAAPAQPTYFPPVGGFRFGMFSLPPQSRAVGPQPTDTAAAARELEAKLPGLAGYMEPDAPGMHTTDTIDFEVVLDGEVWLELDGGQGSAPARGRHRGAERHAPRLAQQGNQARARSRCSSSARTTRNSRSRADRVRNGRGSRSAARSSLAPGTRGTRPRCSRSTRRRS